MSETLTVQMQEARFEPLEKRAPQETENMPELPATAGFAYPAGWYRECVS